MHNVYLEAVEEFFSNHPPEYQVGQAFQPDVALFTVRLESLTYSSFDILAGGCFRVRGDRAARTSLI